MSPTSYLDKQTVLRYLQNPIRISKLVYAGPSGAVMTQQSPGADKPLDAVWFAVLVPDKPIANFTQLISKDFKWFLITSEALGQKKGAMLLVFDFDTPPSKTALTFQFIYSRDAEWLRVLVNVKRLSIYDSPDGSSLQAMTLEFDSTGLRPLEDWLISCSN